MVSMFGTTRTAPAGRPATATTTTTATGTGTAGAGSEDRSTARPPGRCDGLVDGARGGDREAWDRLVRELTPMLRSVARGYRLGEADCSDVVQTVWLRLAENLEVVREGNRVAGWLATTTRREALRVSRGREVPAEPWAFEGEDTTASPEQQVVDRDEVARARCALRRLSLRDQRLLTVLMRSSSPSYTEVAAELGMPVGSIGPTRARALVRLRRQLEHPWLDTAGALHADPVEEAPVQAAARLTARTAGPLSAA
jgi:RNA polymerase sigma factor (sigma-70 family)